MKYPLRKIFLLIGVFLVTSATFASPGYLHLFRQVEKPKSGTPLDKARCMTCHIKKAGGKRLNSYGEDFKINGTNEEALRKIEVLDSDKDGASNASEIASGTLPGDAASVPAK